MQPVVKGNAVQIKADLHCPAAYASLIEPPI